MKFSDIKIFLMHCKSLRERRVFMEQQFNRYGINAEWITDFDAVELTPDVGNQYREEAENWKKKTEWYTSVPFRRLSGPETSLAIKHISTYPKVDRISLFLEDDAILCDDFANKFDDLFSSPPADWDMIFIGNGCNLRVHDDGSKFYRKSHPATKCTDSYLITLQAAQKLANTMPPFHLPIDFELNYQMMVHDFNVYWIEPPLVSQGSQNGRFNGSISH